MIDDRLRRAARQLDDRVVSDPPPLGRRRRPLAPFMLCVALLLAVGWVVRSAVDRSESRPPAVSTVTVATTTPTTTPPDAAIPFVPCRAGPPVSPPPAPPQTGGTLPDPEGGYVLPDRQLLCGDERTAIIANLLADVPVPAGFEVPEYGTNGPSWSSLIYEVSSAVACAWLDEWFIAQAAGDPQGMSTAAAALDTSRDWEMLNRDFMASRSEYIRKWVDAVNGRGGVGPGGGFDVPPTRELAESALVCTWRHR